MREFWRRTYASHRCRTCPLCPFSGGGRSQATSLWWRYTHRQIRSTFFPYSLSYSQVEFARCHTICCRIRPRSFDYSLLLWIFSAILDIPRLGYVDECGVCGVWWLAAAICGRDVAVDVNSRMQYTRLGCWRQTDDGDNAKRINKKEMREWRRSDTHTQQHISSTSVTPAWLGVRLNSRHVV